MYPFVLVLWLLVTCAFARSPPGPFHHRQKPKTWIPAPTNGTNELNKQALRNTEKYLHSYRNSSSTCTFENAARRKEWDSLSDDEKKDYIRAVRCLQTKPSISGDLAPGARNRYDDFVGTHINQTLSIHSTGNFLTWHRYFVHTYETALREECSYTSPLPYINWARYSNNIIDAPLFDGSDTSISDNGKYVPHKTLHFPSDAEPVVSIPPSEGGGCIQNGPFKDYKVNLGAVALVGVNDTSPNPRKDGLGYNPRCIRRDLSATAASGCSDFNITKLITKNDNIASFQNEMQGPFTYGVLEYGVHAAGHYMISGDPGGDFYASPGDPYFFLHHAQIDRVYWMWQFHNGDLEQVKRRQGSIAGTITFENSPPSRNATLDDRIELGVNDQWRGMKIKEALSVVGGPFCYVYE